MSFSRTIVSRLALAILGIGAALFLYLHSFRTSPAEDAYYRGMDLLKVNMINEAGNAFLESTRANPNYAPAYRALAQLAVKSNAFPLAAEYWQKYAELAPGTKEVYSQLAYSQLMMGQEVPALKSAEIELKTNPTSPQANLIVGILNARKSAPKEALEHLEKAIGFYKDSPKVQLAYGKVLTLIADPRAEGVLKGIIATNKGYAEPYYWLGYLMLRRPETSENLKAGEEYMRKSLNLQPFFPQANLELSKLLLKNKQPQPALLYCDRALKNRKHYPAALLLRSQILQALGRTSEVAAAQDLFRQESKKVARGKALMRQYAANPDDLETELALGQAQLDLDQPEGALIFLQDAIRRAPNDPRVQKTLHNAEEMAKKQNDTGSRQDMQLSIGEDNENTQESVPH